MDIVLMLIKDPLSIIYHEGANIKRDHELENVSRTLGNHVWKITHEKMS